MNLPVNRIQKGGDIFFQQLRESKMFDCHWVAEKMVALIFSVTATRLNDQVTHFQRVHKGDVF